MPGYELIDKSEFKEISEIFEKSKILCRMGFDKLRKGVYKVRVFENLFAKFVHAKYALGVTSGTAALRVALSTIDLKPGDEIITQPFTFVATVEAIIEARAIPVLAEIDETLNLDPNDLLKKITKKTKAVIVVHMLGVPAKLDKIKSICDKKNIALIEDTAWGCGGKYKKKYLGTWGRIGTYSFDFAKTLYILFVASSNHSFASSMSFKAGSLKRNANQRFAELVNIPCKEEANNSKA